MTIKEAFADSKSLIKNRQDIDDILLNDEKNKGVMLGANEIEGRPKDLWFATQKERDSHLNE